VELSISTRDEGVHTVVEVVGELDVSTADRLRERFVDLIADGRYRLVVDLQGVDFLDSTGLGCWSVASNVSTRTTDPSSWSAARSAS